MKKIVSLFVTVLLLSNFARPVIAQLPTANLAIVPASQSVTSTTATVNIDITNASNIGGWGAMLSYNPALIKINAATDITYSQTFLTSSGRSFFQITPQIDNVAGTVNLAAATLGTIPGPNGSGRLVTIVFTKIANGASNLTIQNVNVSTADLTPQTQPSNVTNGSLTFTSLASPVPSPTLAPSPSNAPSPSPGVANVNLSVKFEGVVTPLTDSKLVTVWFKRLSDGIVFQKPGVTVSNSSSVDGTYITTAPMSFISFVDGSYEVSVKGPAHLLKNFGAKQLVSGTNTLDLTQPALLTGDANGDNSIGQLDYNRFISSFKCKVSPPVVPPGKDCSLTGSTFAADFDLNGEVNINDYSYLVANYQKNGDVIPQ